MRFLYWSFESVRQLHKTILYGSHGQHKVLVWPTQGYRAVNHALVMQSWFIHQTWSPASLEIKDTEVRAYRTDPVQVRS